MKIHYMVLVGALLSCSGGDDGPAKDSSSEVPTQATDTDTTTLPEAAAGRNDDELIIPPDYHPLGLGLTAVVDVPEGQGPFPGCVILHGSGGLFREGDYGDPCTEQVESKFEELRELLASEQVAVILPSSFFSRDERFCEDNSEFIDFAPADYDRTKKRTALRTYDLLATTNYFCDRSDVDCDNLCFVGTSDGGSVIVHFLHQHLETSFAKFFADDGDELAPIPYVPIPPDRHLPQFAQAISPGCGLHGAVDLEADDPDLQQEDIEALYYPAVPLFLDIGENDDVPDECTTAVPGFDGTRQIQIQEVERRLGIAPADSRYRFEIYADGEHDLLGGPYGDEIREAFLTRVEDFLK